MEQAKSSVFDMIHDANFSAALAFEDRVNIALQLSKGLEVCTQSCLWPHVPL
jgi:hypothetical protein